MGEEYKKPLRKLKVRGNKQYSTVEYGAKPQKGNVYQYILDLNDRDYDTGIIDDYEWHQNLKDIIDNIPDDELSIYDTNQDSMLMPEMTSHAGLSPKKVLHTTDAYADRSLQRSFDIIANNPDLYGTFLSKRFKSRSPSSFRKSWPEIISSMPPGFKDASAITTSIGSAYTEDVLYGTDWSKNIRGHELNHTLWNNILLNRKHKKVKNIIYDAYSPHEGDFDSCGSGSEIDELIASNSDLRNHLYEHGLDPNNYKFFEWGENEIGGYEPYVNMPTLSGYFPSIRTSIKNYANNRYSELINERGEDHADEIRQEITDEINRRIRLALSKVAYNQVPNQDQPLYAKSGGVLIPKFGEGSGAVDWILRQIAKVSPKTARLLGYTKEFSATEKEIATLKKGLQGQSKNLQGLQKGVQRAQKISKSQQFKELVSGLELEDRVSSELISRYNALDPNKQKAERDIVFNLTKDGQIHSITDFDLAIDKIGRGKQAKDPNLYKYKKLADFDSEHTLGYFQKLEEEKAAKEKYDQAFGSFEKRQAFPELGLSLYSVPETLQGQTDLAYVMRQQDPKTPAPWCVLQTDKEGNPTVRAQDLWAQTYGGPKYVLVDNKGKIQYFKSGDEKFFNKQDQPMEKLQKSDNKTGIKTYYSIIGERHPFQFVIDSKKKTMQNGNEITLYYRPNGTLSRGYIRRPNNYTSLLYPKNKPAEVTLYQKGLENVPMNGAWVTTPSGQRLFRTRRGNVTNTYDETGRLLQQTQGVYGTIFGPKHILTFGNGEMALWKNDENIMNEALDDLYTQQQSMGFYNEPIFRQHSIPSTGELIKDGSYSDFFKNIGDAIQQLGFKFPIHKKGGILKGKGGIVPGWMREIYEAIIGNSRKTSKEIEELSKGLKQQVKQSSETGKKIGASSKGGEREIGQQNITSGSTKAANITSNVIEKINDIGENIQGTVKKLQPRAKYLGQVVKGAITHPDIIRKSIPLYLRGYGDFKSVAKANAQVNFVKNNFDFLNKFYENWHNFRYGFSARDKAREQLNKNNIKDNILQFNINARNAFAQQHGFNMNQKDVSDQVNGIPITFHFFPFERDGDQIKKNTYGFFSPLCNSVHINMGTTEKEGNTASVIIHEQGAHGLQQAVADEIMGLNWQTAGYDSNGHWISPKDLGNFKHTKYFPEEQNLLDAAYPIVSTGTDVKTAQDLYEKRNKPYTSSDYSSPLEQGATNNEIKYLYANKYGVDFSKLKKPEDLPDLIKLNNIGQMIDEPFTGINSLYSFKYRDNLQSIIDAQYKDWAKTHQYPTSEESRSFYDAIERDLNDKLKKAAFYVGTLSGVAYLGSQLNSDESR